MIELNDAMVEAAVPHIKELLRMAGREGVLVAAQNVTAFTSRALIAALANDETKKVLARSMLAGLQANISTATAAKSVLLAEAETVLRETTAEAIEHRKNIIEIHSGGFELVPDQKYQIELQKEIARFDALIERAGAALAKIKAAQRGAA